MIPSKHTRIMSRISAATKQIPANTYITYTDADV